MYWTAGKWSCLFSHTLSHLSSNFPKAPRKGNTQPTSDYHGSPAKHPPSQRPAVNAQLPGTCPGSGHLTNISQLPVPQQPDTSAPGLLHLPRVSTPGAHSSAPTREGGRALLDLRGYHGLRPLRGSGRHGGTAAARGRRLAGQEVPPGPLRREAAQVCAPAGRGGTSGPAGKLPD